MPSIFNQRLILCNRFLVKLFSSVFLFESNMELIPKLKTTSLNPYSEYLIELQIMS